MAKCRHYPNCDLDAWESTERTGFNDCILHSSRRYKNRKDFNAALKTHREKGSDDFTEFVFPCLADFRGAVFSKRASFANAVFFKEADFSSATFTEDADFSRVTFLPGALFMGATFLKKADFEFASFAVPSRGSFVIPASVLEHHYEILRLRRTAEWRKKLESDVERNAYLDWLLDTPAFFGGAKFCEESDFQRACFAAAVFAETVFKKKVLFNTAQFRGGTDFSFATFEGGADFRGGSFQGETLFHAGKFLGKTIFSPERLPTDSHNVVIDHVDTELMFSDAQIDFTEVTIEPRDAVIFRDADFKKCKFQDTDVREIEFTGVKWPKLGSRLVVYDEIAPLPRLGDQSIDVLMPDIRSRSLFRIERLYRQLKQNYEERRDHERVSDFHYGEKEMRRRNLQTAFMLRFFLTLYWLLSGYGERYLRPLIAAAAVLIASTFLYLKLGLSPKDGGLSLALTNTSDWLRAGHYSFRVMTLLKPDDLLPSESSRWVNTVQSIIGPCSSASSPWHCASA